MEERLSQDGMGFNKFDAPDRKALLSNLTPAQTWTILRKYKIQLQNFGIDL